MNRDDKGRRGNVRRFYEVDMKEEKVLKMRF